MYGMVDKRDSTNNYIMATEKKELCDDVDITSDMYNTSCKRQRTNNGSCCVDRDELSPTTVWYLRGVLEAEV